MATEYLTVEHLSKKRITRIFSKISIDPDVQWNGTPCWNWQGWVQSGGYGCIAYRTKTLLIHRFLYAWLIHPLPSGRKEGELDHLCRNHSCCNPIHLELVPSSINILRGFGASAVNARKTHCPKGHPLSGDNLCIQAKPNNKTARICRTCKRIKNSSPETKAWRRQYRSLHSDHVAAQQRAWRRKNPDKCKIYEQRRAPRHKT